MPAPSYSSDAFSDVHPAPPEAYQRNPLIRLPVLLLFVIASMGIGFGVAVFVKNQSKAASSKFSVKTSELQAILDESLSHRVSTEPALDSLSFIDSASALPGGLKPKTPAQVAKEVLDQFLAA